MNTFTLTDIESACGVTVDDVTRERSRAAVRLTPDGMRVLVDGDTPPALAGAVARMALGVGCERLGRNAAGHSIYAPAESTL